MGKKYSRRDFLSGSAVVMAGGLLAACQPTPAPASVPPTAESAATAVAPTEVPATAVPATAAPTAEPFVKGQIRIMKTTVNLPTEKVTFRWLDSGDVKATFWQAFFPKYMEAHPNVTIQYDGLPWNEINKIVPLGIQNDNLHDVFSLPQGVTSAQAYSEGWLHAYDDLIPDLQEVKARYPTGSFVEGINVFGGKTYCLPHGSSKRSAAMLLYNREYLAEAGYDPGAKPMTWDDYRAAARKLTEQGAGKYYGAIIGGNQLARWGIVVREMACLAGAAVVGSAAQPDIDYRTGEYAFASPEYIGAMELLLAMKADGSFFPGYVSINAPQARAQIAQGAAGMILQGLWCLPVWKKDNPDFPYGATMPPVADPKRICPLHVNIATTNESWVYAKSKNAQVAADIMYYWVSLEGQYAWDAVAGVSDPGYDPRAYETASADPIDTKALQVQSGLFCIGPSELIRNPEAAKVALEFTTPTPNSNQVIQGLMSGQLTDAKKEFQDCADRYNKELDRAIKAAQDKGAKVSRADWVFQNWDPMKDYTEDDYKEL